MRDLRRVREQAAAIHYDSLGYENDLRLGATQINPVTGEVLRRRVEAPRRWASPAARSLDPWPLRDRPLPPGRPDLVVDEHVVEVARSLRRDGFAPWGGRDGR